MSRLARLLESACLAISFGGISLRAADVKAPGEDGGTFVVATGTKSVAMIVNQHTAHPTGNVADEYGECPLDGRLADDQVTIVWSGPEDGKLIDITMKGKIQGDTIT